MVKLVSDNIYTETCALKTDVFNRLPGLPNGFIIYMSMCGKGAGKVEIQDPKTGLAVTSYDNLTGPPCPESLGVLSGTIVTTSGTWTTAAECASTHRTGRYARFYRVTLSQSAQVTITLESARDTYLYLLEGSTTTSPVVDSNDDVAFGNRNSRVIKTLPAGTYTVEATTYGTGQTGNFTIRFRKGTAAPPSTVGRTVYVGGSTTVDVSGQFWGAVDSYTASSSNSAVATASVTGLTLTITGVAAGSATITVTASNAMGSATQTYAVTVTDPVPTAAGTPVGQSINVGTSTTVDASGDFTGSIDSYSASSFNTRIATASMNGSILTITGAAAGRTTIRVTASNTINAIGTATQDYSVTVVAGTTAVVPGGPRVNAWLDQTVAPGVAVKLFGTGSPADDDDDVDYSWTQQSGTAVSLKNVHRDVPYTPGLSSNAARFTAPSTTGTLVFRLTVKDRGTGLSSWDEMTVTVR